MQRKFFYLEIVRVANQGLPCYLVLYIKKIRGDWILYVLSILMRKNYGISKIFLFQFITNRFQLNMKTFEVSELWIIRKLDRFNSVLLRGALVVPWTLDREVPSSNFETEINLSGSRFSRPFSLLDNKLSGTCLRWRKDIVTKPTKNTPSLLTSYKLFY